MKLFRGMHPTLVPPRPLVVPSDLFSPANLALTTDVLVKLGIGAILGGIVGLERELHGRPAGLRTHMLVVLGVILFCEVSKAFSPSDQTRIAAQIVTGIGFLGAGSILRNGAEVHGLTSAASVWAVSGIAMAVSVGGPFLIIAGVATVLTLITLNVIERLESLLVPGLRPNELVVTLDDPSHVLGLLEALGVEGGRISGLRVLRRGPPVEVHIDVQGSRDGLMRAAAGSAGVAAAHWKK
jgi:putative Mg2+ transporter-C (MgtC) family protein